MPSARLGKSPKSDILFHLSTSGGLSGVRKESEVVHHGARCRVQECGVQVFRPYMADMPEYERLIRIQNEQIMDTKLDRNNQKLF